MTARATLAAAEAKLPRPTEPFRREHAEIRAHLEEVRVRVGAMVERPGDPHPSMAYIVKSLSDHVKAHSDWEERVLYPVIDQRAGDVTHPFTAVARHEHRIIARWIDDLAHDAATPSPDRPAFARRVDNLLGLLWAHFEAEEEILLPLLDATMTPEQFQREILSKADP